MASLIYYELVKTFRKLRTYIGFLVILVLVPLIYWGFSLGGDNWVDNMTRGLQNDFLFVGSLFNGWLVSNMIMRSLFVHIPFLIVLVAGDVFAGEATGGTFRMLMTRPPSRLKLFTAKVISTMIYVVVFIAFMGIVTVSLGLIWFGGGDLFSFSPEGISIISADDVWWRFVVGYGLAAWAMCTIAALGYMLSTIVENAIGPIIGAMAVVIVSLIISNVPIDAFEAIKPYLFTTYMDSWMDAFTQPVDWKHALEQSGILALYFMGFTATAWIIFSRKDILS
ncbi:MAG: hypothetical protein CL946_11490 [Ectothiorhodospiraceae bacterium]|nr:hypothetical protein [Ectothiorhodospiraceae bacterium]